MPDAIPLQWSWNGPSVLKDVEARIDAQMIKLGEQVVEIAKRYTPVRSGHPRNSERCDYNRFTHALVFISDVDHDSPRSEAARHWRSADKVGKKPDSRVSLSLLRPDLSA